MKVKKRGISEVVAALLLLAVTVAAFGFYYVYYVSGLKSSGESVAQGIQNSVKAEGELMSLVSYSYSGGNIYLYLYNYGTQPIIPQKYYITTTGGQRQDVTQFSSLTDATNHSQIYKIWPQELAQLSIDTSCSPTLYVDIVDSVGKTFEFQLSLPCQGQQD